MAEKPEVAEAPVFDKKWLEGLKFKTSEEKIVEEEGRKVKKFIPKERPLKESDILGWKDNGNSIVLVTADGQKVSVNKKEK